MDLDKSAFRSLHTGSSTDEPAVAPSQGCSCRAAFPINDSICLFPPFAELRCNNPRQVPVGRASATLLATLCSEDGLEYHEDVHEGIRAGNSASKLCHIANVHLKSHIPSGLANVKQLRVGGSERRSGLENRQYTCG